MPTLFKRTGYGNLDLPARRAVKALLGGGNVPPDRVVSTIYQFASVPESQHQDRFCLDFAGSPEFAGSEITAAFAHKDIALALVPKKQLVLFNPSAIAELLRQDPEIGDRTNWETLIYSLVVYNFRVANITIQGEKVHLDVHQYSQESSASTFGGLGTPQESKKSFWYSLLGILLLGFGSLFSKKEPTTWQVAVLIGFASLCGISLYFSGRRIGIKTIWAILIAGAAFLVFIGVLLALNWI